MQYPQPTRAGYLGLGEEPVEDQICFPRVGLCPGSALSRGIQSLLLLLNVYSLNINYCWTTSTATLSPRAGRTLTSLRNLCLASASGMGAQMNPLLLWISPEKMPQNCSHSYAVCVLFFLLLSLSYQTTTFPHLSKQLSLLVKTHLFFTTYETALAVDSFLKP